MMTSPTARSWSPEPTAASAGHSSRKPCAAARTACMPPHAAPWSHPGPRVTPQLDVSTGAALGEDDILPDPMSAYMADIWQVGSGEGTRAPERGARPGRNQHAMTSLARAAVLPRTTALVVTLGLSATCWIVAVWRMNGMAMGVATRLDPFPAFLAVWAAMMAAMMLPGAAPAVLRRVADTGQVRAVPAFLAGYLAVWTLVGVAVYACYRPHGTAVAGVLAIAAGGYELTPTKRFLRRCCQDSGDSGLRFGLCCVGSGIGLTVLLVALGVMSVGWMAVLAVLSLAQKLLPPRPAADIPVALAIVGLGVLILLTPGWIPGITPSM
jgi:predicted metal-binding membrane protein